MDNIEEEFNTALGIIQTMYLAGWEWTDEYTNSHKLAEEFLIKHNIELPE